MEKWEQLVSIVLSLKKENNKKTTNIIDIGCGTGIIGISTFLEEKIKGEKVQVDLLDSCSTAVDVTKKNMIHLLKTSKLSNEEEKNFSVIHGDFELFDFGAKKYDIILSNPPYLSENELKKPILFVIYLY